MNSHIKSALNWIANPLYWKSRDTKKEATLSTTLALSLGCSRHWCRSKKNRFNGCSANQEIKTLSRSSYVNQHLQIAYTYFSAEQHRFVTTIAHKFQCCRQQAIGFRIQRGRCNCNQREQNTNLLHFVLLFFFLCLLSKIDLFPTVLARTTAALAFYCESHAQKLQQNTIFATEMNK